MLTIERQRHSLSGLNPEPPNNIHTRGTFDIEVYGIDCLQQVYKRSVLILSATFACHYPATSRRRVWADC